MAAQLAPVADIRTPVGQLAEPTCENVEAVAAFVAELKKPSISWETSRNQVMCRTGVSCTGTTHKVTFKEAGGAKKAYALAEKWLAKEMKEYERTVLA